jgi:inhibitor of cysteine peptidase
LSRRLALAVILLLAAGCASAPGGVASEPAVARYVGVVPCASCPAIRLDVTLRSDGPRATQGRYELRRTYLMTRDGDRTFTGAGRWTVARGADGRTIYRLVAGDGVRETFLKIADDELRVLGADDIELPAAMPRTLVRVDPESGAGEVVVGEVQAGRPVRIVPGQDLVVRLASNHTSGYRWLLVAEPDDVLLTPREGTYSSETPPGRAGAGGVETWRLMGVRRGDATLRFEYRRPWERGLTPVRVVTFPVTVR